MELLFHRLYLKRNNFKSSKPFENSSLSFLPALKICRFNSILVYGPKKHMKGNELFFFLNPKEIWVVHSIVQSVNAQERVLFSSSSLSFHKHKIIYFSFLFLFPLDGPPFSHLPAPDAHSLCSRSKTNDQTKKMLSSQSVGFKISLTQSATAADYHCVDKQTNKSFFSSF